MAKRLIQAGVSARPLEAASRETGIAWRMIAPRLHRHRRALDNLALAFPDMPLKERERLAGDMWENLGRTFAEGFFLKQIMAEATTACSRAARRLKIRKLTRHLQLRRERLANRWRETAEN